MRDDVWKLAGLWLVVITAGVIAGAGCQPRETNVEQGIRTQTLHRGMGPSLGDLDPHLATGTTDYNVLSALFEGLVGEDPIDLSPVPGVAESWNVSDDGDVYTFQLRADARWSNGDPITAPDFVASWQRALTPALAADYANLLYVIAGAEAFHRGAAHDFSSVGARALDELTLQITLEYPAGNFLSMLQHWIFYPVHLASIKAVGDPMSRNTPWARPGSMVSNGPFTLSEWRIGERIIVTKNLRYWDAETVRLESIHFHPFEGVDTEERAFRAGQLHVTDALPIAKIATYRRDNPESLRIDPYLGTYFFRINTRSEFLGNPDVRRALNFATDRVALVNQVLRGGQIPSAAFTPAGTDSYLPPNGLVTDFDAAREALSTAGYPGGSDAPPVEILFNTSENHRTVAEAIQQMWSRELGLEVMLRNMENKTVLSSRRAGEFEVLRSVWIADYQDPASFLDIWHSASGNNYTGWSNSDYDRLIHDAKRTPNRADRHALLRQAESLLLREAPVIPIFTFTHVFAIRPEVRGWHPTLLDHHPYKHVWLESP